MILDRTRPRVRVDSASAAPVLSRPAEIAPPPLSDGVEITAGHAHPHEASEMAAFQKKKRFLTDLTLLAAGDIPAMVTIAADFRWLPVPDPFLLPLNAFNAMTGALGLASDVSVVRDCISNPDVPLKDKLVDVAHLGNDVMNTGASMVPLFMAMPGPLSVAGLIFAGGQVLGALGDGAKLLWDMHRGGEQSAHADGDQPHKLVMDRFEQRMGRIPMLAACVGSQSILTGAASAALPAALAATVVSFGGAFGAVYGYTQVRKSAQLQKKLEDIKAAGVEEFCMPHHAHNGVVHRPMSIDKAIATVKRRKWIGMGQIGASTVLIAAGCLSMPTLLVAGLAASTGFALTAAVAEVHANRREIGERAQQLVATTGRALVDRVQTIFSRSRSTTPSNKVGEKS